MQQKSVMVFIISFKSELEATLLSVPSKLEKGWVTRRKNSDPRFPFLSVPGTFMVIELTFSP